MGCDARSNRLDVGDQLNAILCEFIEVYLSYIVPTAKMVELMPSRTRML